MALKPELKSWLEHVGPKLSEDTRNMLAKELEKDDVATVWRETVMARSDYSRAHDELVKEKQELEAKATEATRKAEAWFDTNTKWRNENEVKVTEALKAKEQADAELTLHRAKIKTLADQGLIDPNDPSLIVSNQRVEPRVEQKVSGLTQEVFEAELAKRELAFVKGFSYFNDLAQDHFELTGQRLRQSDLVDELAKHPGKNLKEVWETKYNIPQVKADLAAKAEADRTAKAVAEAIAKDRSERATDVHAFRPRDLDSDTENKHILSLFPADANHATTGSEAVRAASASWERGEFRQTPTAKPA